MSPPQGALTSADSGDSLKPGHSLFMSDQRNLGYRFFPATKNLAVRRKRSRRKKRKRRRGEGRDGGGGKVERCIEGTGCRGEEWRGGVGGLRGGGREEKDMIGREEGEEK